MFTKLRNLIKTRENIQRSVTFDDAGFTITCGAERVSVPWSDVIEVFAYKVDRFAVDDICIGFRLNETHHCWVSEEDVGYKAILEHLSKRFQGIRTDWFAAVAFPAFVENRTTLWGVAPTVL